MKKLLMLVYSVISYIAFLVVFLYLVGFIGGFFVPKSIDSGPASNPVRAILIDTGLILLFALQHLVMAREKFKRWWTRIVPEPIERSTFVLVASLCLALICLLWQPIPAVVWKIESPPLWWLIQAAFFLGWGLVVFSTFLIDHFDLFGLRQAYLHYRGRACAPVPFKVSSLYRYMRHPMMLGFLISLWAAPEMTVGRLILAAEFTAFIFTGVRFEERDLMRFFGQAYLSYWQKTPMVLPAIGKRAPASSAPASECTADDPCGCSKTPV